MPRQEGSRFIMVPTSEGHCYLPRAPDVLFKEQLWERFGSGSWYWWGHLFPAPVGREISKFLVLHISILHVLKALGSAHGPPPVILTTTCEVS